jgi:hypothetical protein
MRKVDLKALQQQEQSIFARIEAERIYQETLLMGTAMALGGIGELFEQSSQQYKALASAEALISTFLAINKTLASVPFPANILASVGIGASGLANVAKINQISFTGGSSGATPDTPSLGLANQARQELSGAFDRNSLTNGANQQAQSQSQLQAALAGMGNPVVSVVDINRVSNNRVRVKDNASL